MKTKGALPLTVPEIEKAKSLSALGRSYRAIGRELRRSPHCIKRLLQQPTVSAEVSVKKLELSDLYEKRAYECAEAATREKIEDASLQQLAISSGVFLDKARLIRGESTDNLQVQVKVLMDVCALIRRDRDDEYIPAPRILPVAPDPETPLPIGAGYSHAPSRPAQTRPQTAKTQKPSPVNRVMYHSSKEIEPDSSQYDVLMHGLPK